MRMSDIYLDKLVDKFIKEMESAQHIVNEKERELYLVNIEDGEYIFKEVDNE